MHSAQSWQQLGCTFHCRLKSSCMQMQNSALLSDLTQRADLAPGAVVHPIHGVKLCNGPKTLRRGLQHEATILAAGLQR